jgi:hypothetical protein
VLARAVPGRDPETSKRSVQGNKGLYIQLTLTWQHGRFASLFLLLDLCGCLSYFPLTDLHDNICFEQEVERRGSRQLKSRSCARHYDDVDALFIC